MDRGVTCRPFGTRPDGTPIDEYTLRQGPLELRLITLGAIVTSLVVPDRGGHRSTVVLGHETLASYGENRAYLGAVVGRVANRIAGGRFALDGTEYRLATNDGPNHLHGGRQGFDRHVWTATPHQTPDTVAVTFARTSPPDEEGYPGTLRVSVTYRLEAAATVRIAYRAETDQPTVVNLTQHSYFNLGGDEAATILDHTLQVHASRFLPIDRALIPLGMEAPVSGTPFDLQEPARLASRLAVPNEQLARAGGFDHAFVLKPSMGALMPAATLHDPHSGRTLVVDTTEPAVQVYTGQQLDGRHLDATGRLLASHAGLCLETQHFPDAVNHPAFPSTVLRPGAPLESTTCWRFSAS